MGASFGYFVGVLFAAAGIGYIWLWLLSLIRVCKRWPRASFVSAVALTALLGGATALMEPREPITAALATVAAVVFMVMRWRRDNAAQPAAV